MTGKELVQNYLDKHPEEKAVNEKVRKWLDDNPEKKARFYSFFDSMEPEYQPLLIALEAMRPIALKHPETASQPLDDKELKALIDKAIHDGTKVASMFPGYRAPHKEFATDTFEVIREMESEEGKRYTLLKLLPDKSSTEAIARIGIVLIAYTEAPFWPFIKKQKQEEQQPILKATDTAAAALTKQIPVGVGPEVILDALRLGAKGLKAIGPIESRVTSSRKREVKGPSKIEEKSRPNMRTLIHQNAGYVSSTTIPDIEKLSRGSKDLKKWFMFVMMKANEATNAEGNIIRSRIEFPYKEVVELGMYSRADNAKRGFEKFAASANSGLFNVSITVTDRKGAIAAEAGGHLFGTEIYRGFGVIVLNREQQYLWPLVMDKYGMLPSFYFALDDKAADLLHYVSYLARQNMDKIKSQGYFNIGFRAIQERLCLPAEAGQRNQKRDTIGAIESAVKKIEEQQKDKGTELFRFLLIYNEDESITQQLDNGRLQVEVCGEIKERYSQLQKKKQKKIDTSIKKREQGKAARQKQLQTAESDQE